MATPTYKPRDFNLSGLSGISDKTLELHFGLYEGYVTETNLLTERLAEMAKAGKAAKNPAFAELTRHLGYEYGGMILHEYYFDSLAPKGRGTPARDLTQALEQSFGSFDTWQADFAATGSVRGVGWAVLFRDPSTGQLSNHWITLHEQGVPAGFAPILVMDVWEHAYLLDYKPAERGNYIEAFFTNIDWQEVGGRLTRASRTSK
ncbi:MAG: superoxide dismutase [Candidatus Rokuibacteriota bacterium]